MLRQPICVLLAHVDHGKTSLLDSIRKTSVASSEAGGITQSIGAFSVDLDIIKKICGDLLDNLKVKLNLPGLLFIDTPGHAAFTNLRKRGGSLADIAILVVDINEGFKPQTLESLEILKKEKTPFIVALNKIDLITGWSNKDKVLIKNIESQSERIKEIFNERFYKVLAQLNEAGFNADRFDKIEDFTKQVAMIPTSAKTGEGIPELLMMITGLAQRFLEGCLECNVEGSGKGTVLEVKEEKGLGKSINAVIYDGNIKVGDELVVGTLSGPLVTKVKGLFEMERNKLKPVNEVYAASGVKICASNVEGVISGMPLMVARENLEEIKEEIKKEIKSTTLEIDEEGIVIKADSLGSLEGLVNILKEKGYNVKRASIGEITRKDIAEANSGEKLNKVILGFNISPVKSDEVKVICDNVIYNLVDTFEDWREKKKKELEAENLKDVTFPCKLKVLRGCIFRQSNPAIVGVEILGGRLKTGFGIMKEKKITEVKGIQDKGENISEAKKGMQVAISLPGVTCGRQIKENDILYTSISEDEYRKLKNLKKYLSEEEVEILKEIAEIKRKDNPVWGV